MEAGLNVSFFQRFPPLTYNCPKFRFFILLNGTDFYFIAMCNRICLNSNWLFFSLEFSSIKHFCSICCVNAPLNGKKFEIERVIVARDQVFVRDRERFEKGKFEIGEIKLAHRARKCPRDRAFCSR